jgi:integrase
LHDLRRTFASLLAAKGVPTTRIRDYLGHASIATTESYYIARGQVDHGDLERLPALGAGPESAPAAAQSPGAAPASAG